MRKLVLLIAHAMICLAATPKGNAEKSEEYYYYGFILSCGKTIYYTSLVELTTDMLIEKTEEFEEEYCGSSLSTDPEYV